MSTTHVSPSPDSIVQPASMLQTIVVATDFSENALSALNWTTQIAKAHGARIVVVHAIDAETPPRVEERDSVARIVRHRLEDIQASIKAERIATQSRCDFGRPWDVINRVAKDSNADLIVVGAHGQSTIVERVLGTSADRLIRTTSVPVLVHRGATTDRADPGSQTVLAASDFSEESALAISTAVRLLRASAVPARLVLMHAVPLAIGYGDFNMTPPISRHWDEVEKTAGRLLETLAASIRSDRLQVEVKTYRGLAADVILREAEKIKPDLIAIGTIGRSGLNRFFIGSVAQQLLHRADCPVLTVRKPDASEPIRLTAD